MFFPKIGYVRKVAAGELTKVGVHLLLLLVAKMFNL